VPLLRAGFRNEPLTARSRRRFWLRTRASAFRRRRFWQEADEGVRVPSQGFWQECPYWRAGLLQRTPWPPA